MRLTIGIPDYSLASQGDIKAAFIRGRKLGRDLNLIVVSIEDMAKTHTRFAVVHRDQKTPPISRMRGMPVIVAFDRKEQRLWLHPCPDGEYELDVTMDSTVTTPAAAPARPPATGSTLHLPRRA